MSGHGAHLGALLGPALLLAFWAGWADLRAWLRRQDPAVPTPLLLAAVLSVGAGTMHALAAPAHWAEAALYGGFFVVTAALQVGWAYAVVVRRGRRLLLGGAVAHLGVVALWLVTRAVGVPLGPSTGQRQALGSYDLACTLLELGVAACCAAALASRPAAGRLPVPA